MVTRSKDSETIFKDQKKFLRFLKSLRIVMIYFNQAYNVWLKIEFFHFFVVYLNIGEEADSYDFF